MKRLTDCIISYIDLIDVKKQMKENSRRAAKLMSEIHSIVWKTCGSFSCHSEICFWNDSVLLYAQLRSQTGEHLDIMKEVQTLKRAIDPKSPSYAICVQGQSFPPPEDENNTHEHLHFLKASSYAFSNCSHIEKYLGPVFQKRWYIDSRIKKRIRIDATPTKVLFPMWPKRENRTIFMYDDNIYFTARRT
ncbi:MAG TPA: hypothetical protein VK810_04120 [Dongiaceae bacterium]|nr:hypothetical protein [Dongiaceae bacterium]